MSYKNFGPLGLFVLSFVFLLHTAYGNLNFPEFDRGSEVAGSDTAPAAPQPQFNVEEAADDSGPAQRRIARRGGYYGEGMGYGMGGMGGSSSHRSYGGGVRSFYGQGSRFGSRHQFRHARPWRNWRS